MSKGKSKWIKINILKMNWDSETFQKLHLNSDFSETIFKFGQQNSEEEYAKNTVISRNQEHKKHIHGFIRTNSRSEYNYECV